MPIVIADRDNLDEKNGEFQHTPLQNHIFLNSVPKSGSHLLKNIIRMFVSVDQHYNVDFIQYPTLKQHAPVFQGPPKLSWGHLLFGEAPAILLKDVRHVLLVRDPYDWVLARARFFLSDNFQANIDHLKQGRVEIHDYLNMMILGAHNRFPTMQEIYLNNAVGWLGTSARLVKYEDIIRHLKDIDTPQAETFFTELLSFMGIELPDDWRARVAVGSDRKQSGTARENLKLQGQEVPSVLPDMQRKLVDYTNPGLREILGYK
ncbi:MAG: hypothetical protein AAGA69_03060 [Pseudomonadota bacterium]